MYIYIKISQVFKDPLERFQQRGGPILSAEDSKSIFGNIPEILAVHQKIVVGREGGREREREGRKEGGKEGGREGRKEGRREGGREGKKEGGKEGGREGGTFLYVWHSHAYVHVNM